jgi:hypothetical protein
MSLGSDISIECNYVSDLLLQRGKRGSFRTGILTIRRHCSFVLRSAGSYGDRCGGSCGTPAAAIVLLSDSRRCGGGEFDCRESMHIPHLGYCHDAVKACGEPGSRPFCFIHLTTALLSIVERFIRIKKF